MSVLIIVLVAGVALVLGGRFYAPVIARVLGEHRERPTPAALVNDGRDFVPTPTPVVFAHHFASIAGAGPIVGPVLAIYYGWLPALLWIVLGGIFLGAVHDFAATHITMREGGKNLAVVARRYLGPAAFAMMIVMLVALLVLVCAAFLDLSATALTSQVPVRVLGLGEDQTLLRSRQAVFFTADAPTAAEPLEATVLLAALRKPFEQREAALSEAAVVTATEPGRAWRIDDGRNTYHVTLSHAAAGAARLEVRHAVAVVGGIASTSVIVITAFSPLIGFLYIKRKTPVWICSLLAIGVCAVSIWIGLYRPVTVQPQTWKLMISAYVLIAAGVPVWLFLQSRDFINVHILYVGIVFLVIALVAAAIRGGGAFLTSGSLPLSNWLSASAHPKLGPGWPILFITIACGAVSGFHSLCAGGTTCKQLRTEVAARHVGYYAMLLESFLAVCVVGCLIVGLSLLSYEHYCYPASGKGNAVLTFALAVGNTSHLGLGIPVAFGVLGAMLLLEGFLVTTLDTAIRLTRYMLEEGWATLLRRYDVFAGVVRSADEPAPERGATEMTGAAGLSIERLDLRPAPPPRPIETHGLLRAGLLTIRYYWVNSGIAVALMLLLGWGNGYNVVWKIFGSANQLLAALALVVASCWLLARHRPVWYTLLPAVFMLATSIYSLVYLLRTQYLAQWPASAPLAITSIIVLAMTAGIVVAAIARFARGARAATVPAA